jgi:hypothetical protein
MKNRPQYYQAIEKARNANDSGVFIEFTLSALFDIISTQEKHQVKHQDELTDIMLSVTTRLSSATLSRKDIFASIGLSGDSRAFKRNIEPLINSGYIEMTLPDKPSSKLQKYRLTQKGQSILTQSRGGER